MELGIPITSHFLMNDKWINTHRENNPPSMEDTDYPSRYMSDLGIQNRLLFEGLEFGTCKFTWNGR